ncbi:FGGY family carbohydrate kinase [Halocella sp. SP3-1]|uniref:xylulokinase n=1 Tax=Halocella sp. SP3-1 TaxID=2382161 RepID=UPI000F757CA5|nr:FGGY family carbohydrate kinase [Halocella sp. SP3-1]AZO94346.1 hypothetical protein D7D81_06890 [Halocella sp. SP3-1]
MTEKYILTYDMGTTMIKLVLFDQEGNIVYDDSFNLDNYNIDGHQVQQAENWWDGIITLTHRLADSGIDLNSISAIVSTGQMEDCLLLDSKGDILTEVLLYSDGRATEEQKYIIDRIGEEDLYYILANNFDSLMSVNKYLWLKKHRKEVFKEHAYLILGAKDYLNFKLTGYNVTDYTNASTTGFMDLKKLKWSSRIIDELEIDISKLPQINKSTSIIGEVKKELAEELKIPSGIPVINGSGDVGASTLGAGAWREGDIYCYLGTTGWLAAPLERLTDNPNVFTLSNIDGEGYILAGAILNAGKPYDWYLANFLNKYIDKGLKEEDYLNNEEKIKDLNAAEKGVFFLPFINGERSPIKVKENNGVFLGLGPETDKYLLLRAVLEGVSFSLKHNLNELKGLGDSIRKLNLIGGGGKSKVWPQILANVLNLEVNVLDLGIGAPSMGTALMAYKALGLLNNYSEFIERFSVKKKFRPKKEDAAIYSQSFKYYLAYIDKLYN